MTLGVLQDRHLAGEHVGQILEHPQRLDGAQAFGAPGARSTGPGGLGTLILAASARSIRSVAMSPAPKTTPKRVLSSLVLSMPAVVEGALGAGDGQLDGPGHDAQVLAIVLGDEFPGVEALDLAGDMDGQAAGVEGADALHAALAAADGAPDGLGIEAERR